MISVIGFSVMFIACAAGWKRRNLGKRTKVDRFITLAIFGGYLVGLLGFSYL